MAHTLFSLSQAMLKDLHYSCQGESHILTNKACQDASFSTTDGSVSIAAVCDGHGGARYFRSDIGSQLAIEVANDCVKSFVRDTDLNLFKGKPFAQRNTIMSEVNDKAVARYTPTDLAIRQLFASIVSSWHTKIERHAHQTPLSDKEQKCVPQKYQKEFLCGTGIGETYGCTLMCYACTQDYWLAFQIGDGKCMTFDIDGKWSEPIPWDERCLHNYTTSLCDSSAIAEFRYCYCGDGSFPLAVFLGSDGMDNSFAKTDVLADFYILVLRLIAAKGNKDTLNTLKEALQQLSKAGSKDDMSIACIYDEAELPQSITHLMYWQKKCLENDIICTNRKILDLQESKGEHIDKELSKVFIQKRTLAEKWNRLTKELFADSFMPYHDEIGFGEDAANES